MCLIKHFFFIFILNVWWTYVYLNICWTHVCVLIHVFNICGYLSCVRVFLERESFLFGWLDKEMIYPGRFHNKTIFWIIDYQFCISNLQWRFHIRLILCLEISLICRMRSVRNKSEVIQISIMFTLLISSYRHINIDHKRTTEIERDR